MQFTELTRVAPEILQATQAMGFTEMTEIQEKAIPLMLGGHDMIAKAPTGTGKTVAFFSITSNNLVTVRKGSDYVARMIEMAGGSYVFADLTDNGNNLATINLSLEDFYAGAKDADVLLYNSTIEGSIASTEQLVEKCPLLAQFKAVQNGNVWCTAQSLFQQSMELPDLILDMNRVFTEGTPADSELTFLTHVE